MLADQTITLVVVVGIGLLCLVALLLSMIVLGRRQQGRDVRELALAVEELRSGHLRRRPVVDDHSPMAVLSDALQRLGQDLSVQLREADGARKKLQAVLDGASEIAVIATDPDWDVISLGSRAVSLLGWSEDALQGESISRLFAEQDWNELLPRLARKSVRERGLDAPARLVRRDGEVVSCRLAIRGLRSADGELTGHLLVIRDDSARERFVDEVRASEQRYRGLVEGLGEGVFVTRRGRLVFVNPALADLCGTDADRMQGAPLREFVASRDVLVAQELIAGLEGRKGRTDLRICLRGAAPGHVERPVRVRATSTSHEGEPAVLGLVEDLASERRREAELRRGRERLDALLESTADGVLAIGDAADGGRVGVTNAAFSRLCGVAAEELLGRSQAELIERLHAEGGVARELARLIADGRSATVADDAGERVLEVRVSDLRDRRGAPLGRLLLCRDRTERRRSEQEIAAHVEELERTRDELGQARERLSSLSDDLGKRGEELERLNKELRRLDHMKNEWLGDLSHDLQAPLVSVRGYTEMILRGRLGVINDEQRKGLEVSLKNIDRLVAMIDNLLAFSRLTREAGQVDFVDVPLHELIDESVSLLRERLESRGIDFSYAGLPPGTLVHGDREMLLRVFTNLLSNAEKFNRDGGRIEVITRAASPRAVGVEVRDTGRGIPEQDLERIFERHYRAETGSGPAVEGSGLGLAIVRDILRLHGSRIRAESVVGRGSVFAFTLPRTQSASGPEEEVSDEGKPTDDDRPRLRIIRPE